MIVIVVLLSRPASEFLPGNLMFLRSLIDKHLFEVAVGLSWKGTVNNGLEYLIIVTVELVCFVKLT